MAIRNVVKEGDDVLRKQARPVIEFNKRLHILLDDIWSHHHHHLLKRYQF